MNMDFQFYWRLFLKRLPAMMALFLICSVTASVAALKLPPTYSTSARLLVEEARIPENMLRTTMQVDTDQQLQVIEERLTTRANMLDIARKHNVFENVSDMTPDEIVREMRGQTRISRTGGRSNEATLMRVSFQARSAIIAANVVNEYVTLILQESTQFRIDRTESTLAFFRQEVERLKDDLEAQSIEIVNFKNENGDALPGDLNYRQNRQALLQERQARLEREIASIDKQRRDLVAIYETTGQVTGTAAEPQTPQERQLSELQSQLQAALSVYSETNPRIVLLSNRIKQLEAAIAQQATSQTPSTPDAPNPPSTLQLAVAEMDQRVETLREELSDVETELDRLEATIQATAGNAIILERLERDYDAIQTRYNEAVVNLNRSLVSERIEVSAQGERITVLENANVPQTPSGPNRLKLVAAGVGAGLLLAVGFFFLLELLNRVIRRPDELNSRFGIIPLAVIPYMESRRERLLRRSILAGACLAVMIGVPALLWYVDSFYMPLDVLANRVFDRLGLT